MIRCLACKETFEDFDEYKIHKADADHPDLGDAFVSETRDSVLAQQANA